MNKEFIFAMDELEKEKEISKELLLEAIESALVSAYKKNYGTSQNVRVSIDRDKGNIDVFMRKDVVNEVIDSLTEISLEEAKAIDPEYEIGDVIEYKVTPKDFGRIAAQTAKQVVVQRIREAERGIIYDDFVNKQSEIVTGIIQRISNETVFVNLGKTEGILPVNEQVRGEKYIVNNRIKVYIMDVKKTTKGPQIYLSRSHPGLIKRLFELEVPEIQDGIVEIKSIAREAGSRTKIAVHSNDENIDPVGACVGTRGIRVQAIVDELFDEKIDIIVWSDNSEELIKSALSPAKVEKVIINEEEKTAVVIVPDYQLSLAIG
ncbi:MAG: transcription termination/antitermination protein NusA, partial [Clostridiales bacterium]|nr:transcription termination/antitermination protein NusA [Clostridiales bacterium]